MGIYKKISTMDYEIIKEYRDIINYIGKLKYNQHDIIDMFENDFINRKLEYDKILYYHKYLKKIFNQILSACNVEDDDYILFKDNADMLINILDSNIRLSEEQIWKILNKYVYNIESKMTALVSILVLSKEGYNLDVRRVTANKGSKYKVKYSCALKHYNNLIFRIYYSDYDNLTIIKLFPRNPLFDKIQNGRIIIQSEEELDDILNKHLQL